MATIVYDFLQDENGDLLIDPITMDFVIGPSDKQHVADILKAVPGWFKKFPLVGFDPYQDLNSSPSISEVNQRATVQLQADGYVKGPGGIDISVTPNGDIEIKALDIYRP